MITGTNGDDTLFFQGTIQTLTIELVNPYTGETIFIDEEMNVNTVSYDGLDGFDTLRMTFGADAFFLTDSMGNQLLHNIEHILGSDGNDIIVVSHESIVLNDIILSGSPDDDILWGNSGNDTIGGSSGNDIINGGPGNDLLSGGPGNDEIRGGNGDDDLNGGNGDDLMIGGDGNDTYTSAGVGFDTIIETASSDTNIVRIPFGPVLDDLVFEKQGNDLLITVGISGHILVVGQFDAPDSGIDSLFFFTDGSTFDLRSLSFDIVGTEGDDVLDGTVDADVIKGLGGNDTITGLEGDDLIEGGAGNDHIYAGDGNDTVYGGDGDDVLHGEDGDDVLHGDAGSDMLYSGAGTDELNGGEGDDFLYGQSGVNVLNGGTGNDRLQAFSGTNTLNGGDGDDMLFADEDGDDVLHGDAGNDRLFGKSANDMLNGGDGEDILDGGAGDDMLDGGADRDTLIGGEGNDEIWGGGGNDVIYGGNKDTMQVLDKDFSDNIIFPSLKERVNIKNLKPPGDPALGINDGNLSVEHAATATLTFRKGYAGYDNTLGIYKIAEDGTIQNVRILFGNVKDGGIDTPHQIDIPVGDGGGEFGFFIIGNGGKINNKFFNSHNKFKDADIEAERVVKFYYDYGGPDQRLATINDDGKDISLIYDDGTIVKALNGHVYHTTARDMPATVNPDGKTHAVSGVLAEGETEVLRIGFEDLHNLGDADFEDVMFELDINEVLIDTGVDGDDEIHGGDGNDRVYGNAGNDVIYGDDGDDILFGDSGLVENLAPGQTIDNSNAGNDILIGGLGRDTLYGEGGDDILIGGADYDKLYGGDGSDEFVFTLIDNLTDTIYDFTAGAGGDRLNITDILDGFDAVNDALSDFVRLITTADYTRVQVDSDGAANGVNYQSVVILQGVTGLTLQGLVDDGNLITDQSAVV